MDGDDKEAAIQQMQEICDNLTKELTECRKRRKDLADEARALKTTIRDLEAQVPKFTLEIAGCDTTREELTRLLPTLEAQTRLSREDEEKLQGLRSELERCQVDMAACTEAAAGLEGEVAALQQQIMEAGGSELKEQQAACKKTLAALNAAEKALNSAKVSISSNEKAIIKAEDAKNKAEAELETVGDEEQSFKDELTSLESDALRVQEAFERVKELEAAANRKMNEASNECEALKSSLSNAKYVEVELLAALEDLDKSIGQAEAKKLKWSGDLEKLVAAAKEDFDEWADDSDESDDSDDDKTVGEEGGSKDNDASMTEGDEDDAEAMGIDADGPAAAASTKSAKTGKVRKPVLSIYDSDELNGFDKDNIKHEIAVLEGERNKIAKNANMGAIAEYRKKEADYLARCVSYLYICIHPSIHPHPIRSNTYAASRSLTTSPTSAIKHEISTKTYAGSGSKCSWTGLVRSRST
jgi:structural maintenance of chromosome 4